MKVESFRWRGGYGEGREFCYSEFFSLRGVLRVLRSKTVNLLIIEKDYKEIGFLWFLFSFIVEEVREYWLFNFIGLLIMFF